MHLRAQSAYYELKGDLSPVMLRKYFMTIWKLRNLQGFVWKPFKCDWVAEVVFLIQILLILGGHCNHYFWDMYGWKCMGYLILICSKCLLWIKRRFEPCNAKEIFHDNLKITKFTRICMETIQVWLGGRSCFSHTNPSNFRWPL